MAKAYRVYYAGARDFIKNLISIVEKLIHSLWEQLMLQLASVDGLERWIEYEIFNKTKKDWNVTQYTLQFWQRSFFMYSNHFAKI